MNLISVQKKFSLIYRSLHMIPDQEHHCLPAKMVYISECVKIFLQLKKDKTEILVTGNEFVKQDMGYI